MSDTHEVVILCEYEDGTTQNLLLKEFGRIRGHKGRNGHRPIKMTVPLIIPWFDYTKQYHDFIYKEARFALHPTKGELVIKS